MCREIVFLVILSVLANSASTKEIACSFRPIDEERIHPIESKVSRQIFTSNWSGYVAATHLDGSHFANRSVTYAAGGWIVPTLLPTPEGTYCAIWVGIDGFLNGTVEQIGTSHNWVDGAQQNYAWFEMYPHAAYEIKGFPVDCGDEMSVRIGYKGDDTFKLVIWNHTKDVSVVIPTSYTVLANAQRSSAEWIVEAPYLNGILPLAHFKDITFNYCSTVINGICGLISNSNWMNSEVLMVDKSGTESQISHLLKNGSCFQVSSK